MHINNFFDFVFDKKNVETDNLISDTYFNSKKISLISICTIILGVMESLLVNLYFGYMVYKGKIWIDMFVSSQNAYSQLENNIAKALNIIVDIYENDLYVKDYLKYTNIEDVYKKKGVGKKLFKISNIKFDDVTFYYPNTSCPALFHVSFEIKGNEHIMFTGSNGAGKTTIMKLLLGLYEPSSGKIYINVNGILFSIADGI